MTELNFVHDGDGRWVADTIVTRRYQSIHLDRTQRGRVYVQLRHSNDQEWSTEHVFDLPPVCQCNFDVVVAPQLMRIVSLTPQAPYKGSQVEAASGSGDVSEIAELRAEIAAQALINEQQQTQIDKNTEVNEQQSETLDPQAFLADEQEVRDLFKQ